MRATIEPGELRAVLVATLRGHGHLCNVLTHIGGGDWRAIEAAIGTVLRPRTRATRLDAVARNIVELVCDGRGVSGPIMRAVFFHAVARAAGRAQVKRLERKVARLRERMRAQLEPRPRPAAEVTAAGHARAARTEPAPLGRAA